MFAGESSSSDPRAASGSASCSHVCPAPCASLAGGRITV